MDGSAVLIVGIAAVVWWFLEIIGNWKLFKKAGRPGWLSIIPFVNIYTEFALCWKGNRGVLLIIAMIAANSISPQAAQGSTSLMIVVGIASFLILYLQIVESHKLAKAFGKGMGYTLLLFFLDRLGRIILGFGSARYIGKR